MGYILGYKMLKLDLLNQKISINKIISTKGEDIVMEREPGALG